MCECVCVNLCVVMSERVSECVFVRNRSQFRDEWGQRGQVTTRILGLKQEVRLQSQASNRKWGRMQGRMQTGRAFVVAPRQEKALLRVEGQECLLGAVLGLLSPLLFFPLQF